MQYIATWIKCKNKFEKVDSKPLFILFVWQYTLMFLLHVTECDLSFLLHPSSIIVHILCPFVNVCVVFLTTVSIQYILYTVHVSSFLMQCRDVVKQNWNVISCRFFCYVIPFFEFLFFSFLFLCPFPCQIHLLHFSITATDTQLFMVSLSILTNSRSFSISLSLALYLTPSFTATTAYIVILVNLTKLCGWCLHVVRSTALYQILTYQIYSSKP